MKGFVIGAVCSLQRLRKLGKTKLENLL